MEIKRFNSVRVAPAIGPYSHASVVDNKIYLSGQIALELSGDLAKGGIEKETNQVLENIKQILEDLDSCLEKVIKTTIFLVDMKDFVKVNKIYTTYFAQERPSRSCVAVAALPKGARIEIEVIADAT